MKKLLSILSFLISVSGFGQTLPNYWVPTSGTDTYTTNITNFGSSYTNKIAFVKFGNTNTGTATLQINGIASPPALRMWDGDSWEALTASQIDVNTVYKVAYSGSFWELESFGTSVDISSKQDLRPDQVYVTGTTYTPTDADAGKIIHLTNATSTTVTLATGIDAKTVLTFVRDTGAGLVTFVDDGTSSLLAPNGETLDTELAWATWIKDETLDNFYGVGALGPAAGGAVDDVFGRTGSVTAQSGDYTATQITNTPSGNISAITAQNAINELDTEKQAAITFGTGVLTALGINVGSAGAPVLYNGAGGTPSSIVLTNATGTASGLTAGTVTTNANLTGHVTSTGNAAVLGSFSSSNLSTALTDKTGTGSAVFAGSPALTGTPTAPTASASDNSTQIATTAFVKTNSPKVYSFAFSDESTALTSGTAKITFSMPYAMTVTNIYCALKTAQSSGSIFTIDINEAGATILSTKITIDNTETDSYTAATAPVISDSSLAIRAVMTLDIDQVGNGTAIGGKCDIIGY